jgi:hypothetical protein
MRRFSVGEVVTWIPDLLLKRGPTCQIEWLFARRDFNASVALQLNHTADSATRVGEKRFSHHLVGGHEEARRDVEAKFGGGQIDNEIEPSRMRHRQVGRLGALEGATGIDA